MSFQNYVVPVRNPEGPQINAERQMEISIDSQGKKKFSEVNILMLR